MVIGLRRLSGRGTMPINHDALSLRSRSKATTGQQLHLATICGVIAVGMFPFILAALLLVPAIPAAREQHRPGFVGSAACAACHAAEATAWRESDHAHAMAPAAPATILGDFSGGTATDGRHTATFLRQGDRYIIRTDGPGGAIADFIITEAFGFDPLQQYLVLFPDGRRQVLPWAWDTRSQEQGGQRWYHLMAQEPLPATDTLHWSGREQTWNFMCAGCHSSGVERNYDPAHDRYDTTWTEISVGCESCHGPGAAHVAWARSGARGEDHDRGLSVHLRDRSDGTWRFTEGDPRGIAHWDGPPRPPIAAQTETCAPCHARARPLVPDPLPGQRFLDTHAPLLLERGEYHADGQIQGEVFEWGSFAQSRMNRAGVVCADCHNPHSGRLRAEGNAVCAQCHLPARFDTAEHHHHPPESTGAQCVACHMPAATYMGVDRRRDHAFSIPRPDIAQQIAAPDACTSCHAGHPQSWASSQIANWFGSRERDGQHPAFAIAAGRARRPGADTLLAAVATNRTHAPILRATAISLLPTPPSRATAQAIGATLLDPEPLVRAAALRALDGLHPSNRLHAARLLADEIRLVRIEAARALAPVPAEALPEHARAAFVQAWDELIASERMAAERPEAHVNIAGLLAARGDMAGAEASYRDALARDATHIGALVNFADFEAQRGRYNLAEDVLRRAVAAHPQAAGAHHALALVLARQGRTADALASFSVAAGIRPEEPRYAYVLAIALHQIGQKDEARVVLKENITRHPLHRDSLMALATIERDHGSLAEAERLAAHVVALNPGDREAASLLDQLQASRQDRARPP